MKGFEDYLEQVAQAGRDIDAAADNALEAGAGVAVEGMRRRVHKDTHNLERSIDQTAPKTDGNVHSITVGLIKPDADTARYGMAQEYGWADRQGAKAGQSYIRATVDEDGAKIRSAERDSLKKDGAL